MKLMIWMLLAGTALCTQAAERNREFVAGRDYYTAAEFGKAAVVFQVPCNLNDDAEACYWTGLSYERLADIRTPFGCRTSAKAHHYLRKADSLAPQIAMYREALFDFLLEDSDCSRTALQEAAGMLSEMRESGLEFDIMRIRLEQTRHRSGSADERLARLFLIIPRATYQAGAVTGTALQLTVTRK